MRLSSRTIRNLIAGGICVLTLTGTASAASGGTPTGGPAPGNPSAGQTDWTGWQATPTGSRHNPAEHRITPGTVHNLTLKWAFAFPKAGTVKSQPVVVGEHAYFGGTDGTFHAVDARTGHTDWTYDINTIRPQEPGIVLDGATVQHGRVYFGDSRGYVYALDQRTGRPVWSRDTEGGGPGIHTSSPLYYRGRIYIGASSAENTAGKTAACCTFRGHIDALDADTGRTVWRHYTVPAPHRAGSWPSGAARYEPSGVSVWSTPVVDPRTGTLYVGTGQNYTGHAGEFDSLLALDARTGAVRWRNQVTDADTWRSLCNDPDPNGYCPGRPGTALDYDIGASPTVFTAGGRTLVGVGQKSGVYHVFDAHTGTVVWRRVLGKQIPSGGIGGIQWGASYDGHALYVSTYFADPGTLYALDPATGRQLWRSPNPATGCTTGGAARFPDSCVLAEGAAATSTPGLVWEGSNDGKVRAYDAVDGRVRWTYDTVRGYSGVNGVAGHGGAVSGNGGGVVVSHGMAYVMSGYSAPAYPSEHGPVLLAFALR